MWHSSTLKNVAQQRFKKCGIVALLKMWHRKNDPTVEMAFKKAEENNKKLLAQLQQEAYQLQ